MKNNYRLGAWLMLLAILHGCAAATMVRKQPDFDKDNKRRLQQLYPVVTFTSYRVENSPVSR